MSRLREISQFMKEDDPARNITVSIPSSLVNMIEKIVSDTGLGRSSVVKALLQDGLIEYKNAPIVELIRLLEIESAQPEFEGSFESERVFKFIGELLPEDYPETLDSDFVFSALREKLDFNRKAVIG